MNCLCAYTNQDKIALLLSCRLVPPLPLCSDGGAGRLYRLDECVRECGLYGYSNRVITLPSVPRSPAQSRAVDQRDRVWGLRVFAQLPPPLADVVLAPRFQLQCSVIVPHSFIVVQYDFTSSQDLLHVVLNVRLESST
ncbi:hypothetical protein EXIGLDRAFT_349437 [Exidia glandulosa HHB12029]|uniref:Uncharacterized protein n=1 Tax=Exidia glandulosa HHB12029 TaxID=1314781 RepID=A0A165CEK3_EXIGL|nr:hypothetical protein EXIGLDRAFT_349437 [Exidia glandulosa HHB12029]